MALVETDDLISIAGASKLGVSALVREAEQGREKILLRNNTPVAAMISIQRLEQLQRAEDDFLDLALAQTRAATTGPERASLDEVLDRFGFTREQLRALPD
jgi:antitoxin (DNA-binding transcriptional repressor) of toxin-antitoxin stability system